MKGSFQVKNSTPIVCIGPGTGVAPFRSLILERINSGAHDNTIYFGCRSRHKDFYFEAEWSEMSSKSTCRVYTAFSRDQPEKVYVQDVMWTNRDEMFRLIDRDQCCILIAGSSKRMPDDVLAYLEKIVAAGLLASQRAMSQDEADVAAKEYVREMDVRKRIQMETWS